MCFNIPEVAYLGHRIDIGRFHQSEAKAEVILQVLATKHLTEFKAFLGLLHYYGKFLPNLSTVLAPQY